MCAFGHPGTILHPFGRQMVHPKLLAGKWCIPNSNPAAFQDDLMLQSWIMGRRSGRCVPWVTLSRPDKGPNTGNAITPQHMHAFKPDQV